MRPVLFLVLGLLIGGTGAALFTRSLPPETGSQEEKVALLTRDLARAQTRIAALEHTEANAAARRQRQAQSGVRSIMDDIREGRPVDVNHVFNAAKPFLHDFAPLFERLRLKEQKQSIERTLADLSSKYHLDAAQQATVKKWLEEESARTAAQWREVVGREDSTVMDFAKASRDFRPYEGIDAVMEQTLRGEDLARFKNDRLQEKVTRVQYEAERRVDQLNSMVGLDDAQQDQVFSLMARSSRDFDPSMQFEGLGDDRATLARGQSRDEAIMAVLRPDQREKYEAGRAVQREEANREMSEIGLKLPDDWDMFDD